MHFRKAKDKDNNYFIFSYQTLLKHMYKYLDFIIHLN